MLILSKIKRSFITGALIFAILFGLVVPISANGINTNINSNPAELQYSADNIEILEKIDELGMLKAKALSIKKRFRLSDNIGLSVDIYENTLEEIELLRSELISLGAKPSKQELANIKLEHSVLSGGILIDDFADFEYTFGDVFDLWGISQTVNASYGTFYTYDVVIQDVTGNDILSTSLYQGNSYGFDIYTLNSSALELLVGEVSNVIFDKMFSTLATASTVINVIYNGAQILESLKSINNELHANDGTTINGTASSYKIYCTATSTVHFIFVRNSQSSPWQHSFTTNKVHLNEEHDWHMSLAVGGGRTEMNSGDKDYSQTIYPEDYTYRLTNAITAYRNNKSLYYDIIDEYIINVTNKGDSVELASLDITCPMDQFDLMRYAVQ